MSGDLNAIQSQREPIPFLTPNNLVTVPFKVVSSTIRLFMAFTTLIQWSWSTSLNSSNPTNLSKVDRAINGLAIFLAVKHKTAGQNNFLLDLSSDSRLKIISNTRSNRILLFILNLLSISKRNEKILELAKSTYLNKNGVAETASLEDLQTQLEVSPTIAPTVLNEFDEWSAESVRAMVPHVSKSIYCKSTGISVVAENGKEYILSYELVNHPVADVGLIPSDRICQSNLFLPVPLARMINMILNSETPIHGEHVVQNTYGRVSIVPVISLDFIHSLNSD